MVWHIGIKAVWKLNKINGDVKSASVHNQYTRFCNRLKRMAPRRGFEPRRIEFFAPQEVADSTISLHLRNLANRTPFVQHSYKRELDRTARSGSLPVRRCRYTSIVWTLANMRSVVAGAFAGDDCASRVVRRSRPGQESRPGRGTAYATVCSE
jgi:hypothetical protein